MDSRAYLERIGFAEPVTVDAATLRRLHEAHLMSVPFENIDIHLARPIHMDEARFYDKIVTRRRGGFCYELNGAFAWLLRSLGFDVTMLSAGVYDPGADRFGPQADHMCLLVKLDRPWLADVGFGDSFIYPLPLDELTEHPDAFRRYRLGRTDDDYLVLSQQGDDGSWVPQYQFTLRPQRLYDFIYACHWMQTAADSIFTQKYVCTVATPDGRVTVSNMRLIETKNGTRTEQDLSDPEEREEILRARFGVHLDR